MTQSLEELQDGCELLTQELLSLMLRLAESQRDFEGSALESALRETLSQVGAFGESLVRDRRATDDGIRYLGQAASTMSESKLAVQDDPDPQKKSVVSAALADSLQFLEQFRADAIESMVEFDRATGSRPRGDEPTAAPFTVAPGVPTIVRGVATTILRLIGRQDDDRKLRGRDGGESDKAGDQGELDQVERLAREAMEDLAGLSTLRRVSDREAWSEGRPFDERLLANYHALVSLAMPRRESAARLELTEALYKYATEWVVPDLGRTFAFAFVLACNESPSAAVGLAMALPRADPRALPAYVDALALGANPACVGKLLTLLPEDAAPEVLVVVLEAALRRSYFHRKMLALSTHPHYAVASTATRLLPLAPPTLATGALTAAAASGHSSVRIAAGTGMSELGMPQAREVLGAELDAFIAGANQTQARLALRALSVLGDKRDAARVWNAAHRLRAYRDVGFFGHAEHGPALIAAIEELAEVGGQEGDDQRWCAAGAVKRISGVNVPNYGVGYPDVAALRRDFGEWLASGPSTNQRLRWGREWNASTIAPELADPDTHHGDRRLLARELLRESSGKLRFDVDGWNADQRSFLEQVTEA